MAQKKCGPMSLPKSVAKPQMAMASSLSHVGQPVMQRGSRIMAESKQLAMPTSSMHFDAFMAPSLPQQEKGMKMESQKRKKKVSTNATNAPSFAYAKKDKMMESLINDCMDMDMSIDTAMEECEMDTESKFDIPQKIFSKDVAGTTQRIV
jgi:hypothetical protein